jgi:CRP/FNR family cyclic AMP-dependent transcriptional regulator
MRKALFLLGVLQDGDIEWMVSVGNREKVPKGKILIEEGKEIDYLYIVADGTLAVLASALGNQEIARLKAGEVLGEMSFVDSSPPSASVVALEDCLVLSIPRSALKQRLENPEFAARFYRALAIFLANRLRNTVLHLGYGKASLRSDQHEEVGPTALETLSVAGARFEWMLKRLRGQ